MIKIIKSLSLSLSLSHSHISVSTSPTHAFADLNVTDPSPKSPIHISDPCLRPILHLNAHLTPNHAMPIHISNPTPPPRPLLWFSANQTHASTQSSISMLTQCQSDHYFGFPLIRPIHLRPISLPTIKPTPTLSSSPKPRPALWLVIFYFVWSKLRKKIGDFGWWFFFFFFLLLWTSGGGGWCCGCFLDSGIYYFIMMFILFYCVES